MAKDLSFSEHRNPSSDGYASGYSTAESHYLPLLEAERAKVAKLVEGLTHISSFTYESDFGVANALQTIARQLISEYKTT